MKKIIPGIFMVTVLVSCSQPEKKGKIAAKRTMDMQWLDSVTRQADSSYTKSYKRTDFATAEFYSNRQDSSVCQLMKDSTGMVRQVIIAKKGTRVFFAQYYANGQLQADLPLDEFGQYHGNAIYYYENGITGSSGVYQHGLKKGEWKNYDDRGNIVSTEEYDANGQPIKKKGE